MAKRTATLTPKPSKGAKRAKSALRTEPLSSEALFTLGGEHALVEAEVLRRPSQRNRSPYVADIRVAGREAICHVPSLDLGGKCVAGSTILVKLCVEINPSSGVLCRAVRNEHHHARTRHKTMISAQVKPALDTKGNLVGPDAVNPKYGTPKCEFHCQLAKLPGGGWVGAHPSLGERAAVALLQRSPVLGDVWTGARAKAEIRREVTGPRGQDMRADFVVSGSEKDCVLEVKTVVDASVDSGVAAEEEESGPTAALFPWGSKNQKGPEGEKVVSARAIKHVDALAAIAEEGIASAAVLFVCARNDCSSFRPHAARCPSFAAHLKDAKKAGVTLVARRIRWDVRDGVAHAFDDGAIPVDV